ncbi:MAG: phosphopantothenoylcysteine decarboxylase [Spirochaetia bacterium]|nr:phosphopantothenoylcysteine decarboxylase [Spirochaetia bacterium]
MNILLGVSASVAIYKACDLVRNLSKLGHNVCVVLTKEAAKLISPVLFSSLSGKKTYVNFEDAENGMAHIECRNNIDLFLIAPATADLLSRLACGRADDVLTAAFLSYEGKKWIAPSMNPNMFKNPATQKNLLTLKEYGCKILSSADGESVCGETGEGKMMSIEEIIAEVEK